MKTLLFCAWLLSGAVGHSAQPAWLSPNALAASPDRATLYVTCATGNRVLFFNVASGKVSRSARLPPSPTGLCVSADGKQLFVTCASPASRICIVDTLQGRVERELKAGHTAMAPVLSPDGKTLFVCNRFDNDVSVFDLGVLAQPRRIAVCREPVAAALTPDGRRLLVANHLPAGRSDANHVAAVISVVDTGRGAVVDELDLPDGSGGLNDLRISPDGRFAVVTHLLASFRRPTTQVERGWMNSNVATFIALDRMEVLNTVPLDDVDRGAANPWGAAWSADSRFLVIAHAGSHEISVIDVAPLLARLERLRPEPMPVVRAYGTPARTPADVRNDFAFLGSARRRISLPGDALGPRAVVVVGGRAWTANYFSDTLSVVELEAARSGNRAVALGRRPRLAGARLGELCFHDGRLCRQSWQSCASCHPDDGRMDGLNWDLLNDGAGNPKNTKSLLLAPETPPAMSLGVRETAADAVRSGLKHILFSAPAPAAAAAIDEYLRSLKPVPSPRLVNGLLSRAAERGKKLFFSRQTGCAQCHPPPRFTDGRAHEVGTRGLLDGPADVFDTQTLIELWRTAPYLHDGSAAQLRDVLTFANPNDRHGCTSQLTADQILDLCEYLLSL